MDGGGADPPLPVVPVAPFGQNFLLLPVMPKEFFLSRGWGGRATNLERIYFSFEFSYDRMKNICTRLRVRGVNDDRKTYGTNVFDVQGVSHATTSPAGC